MRRCSLHLVISGSKTGDHIGNAEFAWQHARVMELQSKHIYLDALLSHLLGEKQVSSSDQVS